MYETDWEGRRGDGGLSPWMFDQIWSSRAGARYCFRDAETGARPARCGAGDARLRLCVHARGAREQAALAWTLSGTSARKAEPHTVGCVAAPLLLWCVPAPARRSQVLALQDTALQLAVEARKAAARRVHRHRRFSGSSPPQR